MDGFIICWKKLEIKFEKSWSAVQIMQRDRTGRIFHLIFPDVHDIHEFLKFVGYLVEEAVHTYKKCIQAVDNGKLPFQKNKKAPEFAIQYYILSEEANMREVLLNIRADESIHRSINHQLSDIPQFYEVRNEMINISSSGIKKLLIED